MLANVKKVHVLACGGIGMSAICLLLLQKGVKVSGSDAKKSPLVEELIAQGLQFIAETDPFATDVELIVSSSAIKEDHFQLRLARASGLACIHRAKALAELMEGKKALLVAGTHGKTTTASLLTHALKKLGAQPSYAIGGTFSSKQAHACFDIGPYFVAEADESDGSFLSYHAYGMIVTNIDKDHMDYWKTEKNLEEGFLAFITACENKKCCLFYGDDPRLMQLGAIGTTYGLSLKSDFRLIFDQAVEGGREFIFLDDETKSHRGSLALNGHHNVLNALGVFGLLKRLGYKPADILEALRSFEGVDRRCQIKGYLNKTLWIDDYAHHPTEIKTTLQGIKEKYPSQTIAVIFQPHRFSRTLDLWDEYYRAFFQEDILIVTDIYGAGEANENNLCAQKLALTMASQLTSTVRYIPRDLLKTNHFEADIVVTFGAGDITHLYHEIRCL